MPETFKWGGQTPQVSRNQRPEQKPSPGTSTRKSGNSERPVPGPLPCCPADCGSYAPLTPPSLAPSPSPHPRGSNKQQPGASSTHCPLSIWGIHCGDEAAHSGIILVVWAPIISLGGSPFPRPLVAMLKVPSPENDKSMINVLGIYKMLSCTLAGFAHWIEYQPMD